MKTIIIILSIILIIVAYWDVIDDLYHQYKKGQQIYSLYIITDLGRVHYCGDDKLKKIKKFIKNFKLKNVVFIIEEL